MVTAHTSARIAAASKLLEARSALWDIRSLICFNQFEVALVSTTLDSIDTLINSVMVARQKGPIE